MSIWTPSFTSIIELWFNTFDAYYNRTVQLLVAKGLSLSNNSNLHTDICHYNCLYSYFFRLSSLLHAHVVSRVKVHVYKYNIMELQAIRRLIEGMHYEVKCS